METIPDELSRHVVHYLGMDNSITHGADVRAFAKVCKRMNRIATSELYYAPSISCRSAPSKQAYLLLGTLTTKPELGRLVRDFQYLHTKASIGFEIPSEDVVAARLLMTKKFVVATPVYQQMCYSIKEGSEDAAVALLLCLMPGLQMLNFTWSPTYFEHSITMRVIENVVSAPVLLGQPLLEKLTAVSLAGTGFRCNDCLEMGWRSEHDEIIPALVKHKATLTRLSLDSATCGHSADIEELYKLQSPRALDRLQHLELSQSRLFQSGQEGTDRDLATLSTRIPDSLSTLVVHCPDVGSHHATWETMGIIEKLFGFMVMLTRVDICNTRYLSEHVLQAAKSMCPNLAVHQCDIVDLEDLEDLEDQTSTIVLTRAKLSSEPTRITAL